MMQLGVEDLVAAVLAVGLREHHQLDVGRIAAELAVARRPGSRSRRRRAPGRAARSRARSVAPGAGAERDDAERPRPPRAPTTRAELGLADDHALGHAIRERRAAARAPTARRRSTAYAMPRSIRSIRRQAADVGDVGRLRRPRRDRAEPRRDVEGQGLDRARRVDRRPVVDRTVREHLVELGRLRRGERPRGHHEVDPARGQPAQPGAHRPPPGQRTRVPGHAERRAAGDDQHGAPGWDRTAVRITQSTHHEWCARASPP